MALQGWCCRDGAAGMALQGWRCREDAAGRTQQGGHCKDGAAGMVLQGWRCRDGAAGTALQGRRCVIVENNCLSHTSLTHHKPMHRRTVIWVIHEKWRERETEMR